MENAFLLLLRFRFSLFRRMGDALASRDFAGFAGSWKEGDAKEGRRKEKIKEGKS